MAEVRAGCQTCNGYLGHPFEKVSLWAVIASLFHSVWWDSVIDQGGEWFSCTRENSGVGAANSQKRHAQTAGESCERPLEA